MMKKLNLLAVVVVVSSLVLAACAPAAPETVVVTQVVEVEKEVVKEVEVEVEVMVTPTPEVEVPVGPAKVKIGLVIPETGALAEFGPAHRKSADLAAHTLAQAGFPIALVYGNTETSAIPGVDAARMLVDVERVQVLVGAAASGVTVPIAESVAIPSQVPQISMASTSPLISVLPADEGQDFLFRTCFSDALQGVIAGKLAWEMGYKTAAVMWVNNPYGEGLAENFEKAFEYRGGEVLASVPHDEAVAPSYVAELKKATEGNPDVLFCVSYPGHATIYIKEAIEGGFIDKFLFCDGTKSVEMPAEVGPDVLAGMYGTAPGTAMGDAYNTFVAGFSAMYGEVPLLPFMDTCYDGVVVAALAAAKCEADGVEITGVNIRDRLRDVAKPPGEKIMPGLESLKKGLELIAAGEDINYEGAAGSVDFDEHGDVLTPVEIWQYIAEEPFVERVSMEMMIPPQ